MIAIMHKSNELSRVHSMSMSLHNYIFVDLLINDWQDIPVNRKLCQLGVSDSLQPTRTVTHMPLAELLCWEGTGAACTRHIYIYAFSRCFYPKRLTIAFRLYIFISTCVPWESNPQPFVQQTQCSTTEPHRNTATLRVFLFYGILI